jgi:hypothetical protein
MLNRLFWSFQTTGFMVVDLALWFDLALWVAIRFAAPSATGPCRRLQQSSVLQPPPAELRPPSAAAPSTGAAQLAAATGTAKMMGKLPSGREEPGDGGRGLSANTEPAIVAAGIDDAEPSVVAGCSAGKGKRMKGIRLGGWIPP